MRNRVRNLVKALLNEVKSLGPVGLIYAYFFIIGVVRQVKLVVYGQRAFEFWFLTRIKLTVWQTLPYLDFVAYGLLSLGLFYYFARKQEERPLWVMMQLASNLVIIILLFFFEFR